MLDESWQKDEAEGGVARLSHRPWGASEHELGWEAFLVRSAARKRGLNLIIFPRNLSRRSSMEIVNVGELPQRD